jgi:hypothetical protein
MLGAVNLAVVDTIRREYVQAQSSGTLEYKIEVQGNLAVVLLRLGSISPDHAYAQLYDECEELLLKLISLYPENHAAQQNLLTVRKNRQLRSNQGTAETTVENSGVDTTRAEVHSTGSGPEQRSGDQFAADGIKARVQAISYEDGLRFASEGRLDHAAISAMRQEVADADAADPDRSTRSDRGVSARVNLAVALLRLGSYAADAAEYGPLYDESEALLLAALALKPEHAGAAANLAAVRNNRRLRIGGGSSDQLEKRACDTAAGQNQPADSEQVPTAQNQSAAAVSGPGPDAAGGGGGEAEAEVLPFEDALRLASGGRLDPPVIGALRREVADADAAAAASGDGPTSIGRGAGARVNLAVALLRLGSYTADAAEYGPLYDESEALLLAALALKPEHAGAAANLAAVRNNRRLRAGWDSAQAGAGPGGPQDPAHDSEDGLTYAAAVELAASGRVDHLVVGAMRRELVAAEAAGDAARRVSAAVALASTLASVAARMDSCRSERGGGKREGGREGDCVLEGGRVGDGWEGGGLAQVRARRRRAQRPASTATGDRAHKACPGARAIPPWRV